MRHCRRLHFAARIAVVSRSHPSPRSAVRHRRAAARQRRRRAGRRVARRPDAGRGVRRPRAAVAALGADAGPRDGGQGAPRLLPVDGVPDRTHPRQRAGRPRPAGRSRRGPAAARAAPGGHRRPRARRGPRQRRPRSPGRLLSRFDGHARPAVVRLRHPLRVRHVRPGDPRRHPGRASRPLARGRHALGVSAHRHQLPGALRRLGRRLERRDRRRRDLAPRRPGRRQGLRHGRSWTRHRPRQHAAAVEGGRAAASRPGRLQHRRLRARRRGQERVREHLLGPVSERQHPRRARAAPAPGVLLRLRLDAGPRRPASGGARHARPARRQGRHPPQRHAPGDRRRRADAAALRRPRRRLATRPGRSASGSSRTPTTR